MDNQKVIMYVVGVLVAGLLIGGFVSGQAVRKAPRDGGGGGLCSDSDNGQNIFVQGRVSSPSQGSAVDICNSVSNIKEYYCYSKNAWTSANMPCPNGYACSNGACTLSTTTTVPASCFDSDNGINIYQPGYIDVVMGGNLSRVNDYCFTSIGMVEQYCNGTIGRSATVYCPTGYVCAGYPSACIIGNSTTSTTSTTSITTTIPPTAIFPVADTYVYEAFPNNVYGGPYLDLSGVPGYRRIIYLKFSVNNINPISSAKLHMFLIGGAIINPSNLRLINVREVTDDGWTEHITWNNRTTSFGPIISSKSIPNTLSTWHVFDVTPAISGNGVYSFTLISDQTWSSGESILFTAREYGSTDPNKRPWLEIT